MVSYSSWNGAKMHGNQYLITDVLKGELGFTGIVVSDWRQSTSSTARARSRPRRAHRHQRRHRHGDGARRVRRTSTPARAEVQAGRVARSRIDDAISRILTKKFELGLFEQPVHRPLAGTAGRHRRPPRAGPASGRGIEGRAEERPRAAAAAASASKVFVAGKGADNIGQQSGGWTIWWQGGLGPIEPGTTILDGVRAAVSPGTDRDVFARRHRESTAATTTPSSSSARSPYAEFEGDDTGDMRLSTTDRALIDRVVRVGRPRHARAGERATARHRRAARLGARRGRRVAARHRRGTGSPTSCTATRTGQRAPCR